MPTPGNGSANAAHSASRPTPSATPTPYPSVQVSGPTSCQQRQSGVSAEPLDHGLRVTWNAVPTPSGGTPVSTYVVDVGGVSTSVGCSTATCTTSVVDSSLANGTLVTYSVSARNDAFGPLAAWNSTSQQGTPAGAPLAVAPPIATSTSDTSIALDWSGTFSANGRAVSDYTAAIYTGAGPSCAADGTVKHNGATLFAADRHVELQPPAACHLKSSTRWLSSPTTDRAAPRVRP